LATDSHVVCVTPRTAAQDVPLPSTGGVTGTISFGAYPIYAGGCDQVQIATGSAVEIPPPLAASTPAFQLVAVVTPPTPILTISVGEAVAGQPLFGVITIVTGMTLTVSPDLNFPDGTYYATVTTVSGQRSSLNSTLVFTAKNGVLTIAPIILPNGKAFPVVMPTNTSSIIALYARGVIPPAASEPPAPTASPTPPGASSTARPSLPPLATAPPVPNAYGFPPPAWGQAIGYYSYDWAGCTGNPGCTGDGLIEQQTNGGTIPAPVGMWGTITFEAEIGYMGIYEPTMKDCPLDWSVIALPSGAGSIVIPYGDPLAVPPQNSTCTITYQTVPPGAGGSGYEEVLYVQPISIGDVTIEGQPSAAP
jgi:hypothetical protein